MTNTATESTINATESTTCIKCGQSLAAGSGFCNHCGANQTGGPSTANANQLLNDLGGKFKNRPDRIALAAAAFFSLLAMPFPLWHLPLEYIYEFVGSVPRLPKWGVLIILPLLVVGLTGYMLYRNLQSVTLSPYFHRALSVLAGFNLCFVLIISTVMKNTNALLVSTMSWLFEAPATLLRLGPGFWWLGLSTAAMLAYVFIWADRPHTPPAA